MHCRPVPGAHLDVIKVLDEALHHKAGLGALGISLGALGGHIVPARLAQGRVQAPIVLPVRWAPKDVVSLWLTIP